MTGLLDLELITEAGHLVVDDGRDDVDRKLLGGLRAVDLQQSDALGAE